MRQLSDVPFCSADLPALGFTRAAIRQLLERGELVRLSEGVFVDAHSPYLELQLSRSMFGGSRIASFLDSAKLQGLATPMQVHPFATMPRRGDGIHGVHTATIGSLRVGSLAWTALNLARYQALPGALIPLDSALRLGVEREELEALVPQLPFRRGTALMASAIAAADARSESALESDGRGQMLVVGLPRPSLQLEIRTSAGNYRADFAWVRQRVIAEADGEGKYSDPSEEARERRRRNALTKAGWTIVRFGWPTISGSDPEVLRILRRVLAANS